MSIKDEIRARLQDITPSPWFASNQEGVVTAYEPERAHPRGGRTIGATGKVVVADDEDGAFWFGKDSQPSKKQRKANRKFIAGARQDVPWLLDRIDQLEEALANASVEVPAEKDYEPN